MRASLARLSCRELSNRPPGICCYLALTINHLSNDSELPKSDFTGIAVAEGRGQIRWHQRGDHHENKLVLVPPAFSFAACAAQTQTLKLVAVYFAANGSTPNAIQFLCSQKYDRAECVKDATVLRQAMSPYPTQLLGAWSFVLVPADDWKSLVRGQGGDPVSPAFSMFDQRVTLLDGSLFVASANRNKELLQHFAKVGPALVDLAITHEMGHAICQENERAASR